MKLFSAAAVLALATTTTAFADSRSWSTAKGLVPDTVNIVVGANLSTLRSTSLYGAILPTLIAKEPDVQKAMDLAKSTCSIDLNTAVVDVTFAMQDDARGVVVVALDKSIDQKRALDCMTKLVAVQTAPPKVDVDLKGNGLKSGSKKQAPPSADPKSPAAPPAPKLVSKTTGKITEYGLDSDPKRLYIAWLAPDVVAIATDPDDKLLLEKMIGGKGTKGTMSTFLGKASSSSAIWLATTKPQAVPNGGTMKGGFGTIEAVKGNVNVDLSIVMASAKEAKAFVEQVTSLIAGAKSSIPPHLMRLVDALKLSAAAEITHVKLQATEKDLLAVLSMALMNL